MRKVSLYITGVLFGLCIAATTASAQGVSTIGGNPVVERGNADTGYGPFYLMDTNHPFTADGHVNRWEIYADATNPVQLVIYRQTGGVFEEVGRSTVVTPVKGYNLFTIETAIPVKAGDFVGAYMPAVGSISDTVYGGCTSGSLDQPVLFSSSTSTAFAFSCWRVYSLRAYNEQNQNEKQNQQ